LTVGAGSFASGRPTARFGLGPLVTETGQGRHALALQVPLSVAAGLLAAVGLAWIATRPG
jgi:hypothetical protein